MQKYLQITLALTAALFAVACRDSSEAPSPTPTSTPVAATVATTTTATPLALPLATQGTEIPALVRDVVIAAVSGDTARLVALAQYRAVACTTTQGAGGPPKCKPGDTAGTAYRVFATGACDGEWNTDASAVLIGLMKQSVRLYAAVSVRTPTPDSDPAWPKGQHAVLLSTGQSSPAGVYYILDTTGIVRAHLTCSAGETPGQTLRNIGATEFLIPPP